MLITDASRQGKIIYSNIAFKKLAGYEQTPVIGKMTKILQGSATEPKVL